MKPQRRQASLGSGLATLTCSHSCLSGAAGRPVHSSFHTPLFQNPLSPSLRGNVRVTSREQKAVGMTACHFRDSHRGIVATSCLPIFDLQLWGGMLGATSGVALWTGPRVEGQRQMPETPASQRWVRAHSPLPWGRVVCGHPQGVTEVPAEHGRAQPREDALVSCPVL